MRASARDDERAGRESGPLRLTLPDPTRPVGTSGRAPPPRASLARFDPSAGRPGLRLEVLVRWTGLASLGRVPEPNGFAALPEAERTAWTAFWRDVSAAIDRPMEGDPSPAAPTLQRTFR